MSSLEQAYQTQIENIQKKTGKSLDDWISTPGRGTLKTAGR